MKIKYDSNFSLFRSNEIFDVLKKNIKKYSEYSYFSYFTYIWYIYCLYHKGLIYFSSYCFFSVFKYIFLCFTFVSHFLVSLYLIPHSHPYRPLHFLYNPFSQLLRLNVKWKMEFYTTLHNNIYYIERKFPSHFFFVVEIDA